MNRAIAQVLIVVCIVSISCAQRSPLRPPQLGPTDDLIRAASNAPVVDYCQMTSMPSAFDGRFVAVAGRFATFYEGQYFAVGGCAERMSSVVFDAAFERVSPKDTLAHFKRIIDLTRTERRRVRKGGIFDKAADVTFIARFDAVWPHGHLAALQFRLTVISVISAARADPTGLR